MKPPGWLCARPIAHRGLHAERHGVVENSLAAAEAAIAANYAIECDVGLTRDGEAAVFHDETLERLTPVAANLRDLSADEITAIGFRGGEGRIPLLGDLLGTVAGRVPLLVEIKSRFDADQRLARRVAAVIADYRGPLALQTFDPMVLAEMRALQTGRPLGLIGEARYDGPDWIGLPAAVRQQLATISDTPQTRPDFLAWNVADLPHPTVDWWRRTRDLPLLVWTVRTPQQAEHTRRLADQIIFEGFSA